VSCNTLLKAGVDIVGILSWWPILRTRRARCLWCWISASPTTVSEVALTLVLTNTYITLMILINHYMRLPLMKYGNIELTIITINRAQSPLCLLFLKNTYSPITLANISSINLVFIFRCSSSPGNPLYARLVAFSVLVFSLSSHRHLYRFCL
jgi:hypothetical protein